MTDTIRLLIWVLVAAGFANMAPIFVARWFPLWSAPVDSGVHFRGKRIFGAHKTVRGLFVGTLAGILGVSLLAGLEKVFPHVLGEHLPGGVPILFFGLWIGIWALLGDLFKSFFKRQLGIEPGDSWIPFDQIDWIIGALIGLSFLKIPTLPFIALCLIFGLLLHYLIRLVGYALHLNDKPL